VGTTGGSRSAREPASTTAPSPTTDPLSTTEPARVREGYVVPDGVFGYAVQSYVQRGKRFRAELRRL